jgi:hypothetical protein
MKEKDFDILFSKIEKAIKGGSIYLCPMCDNPTKVNPNPYYFWNCEFCEHQEDYTTIPYKTQKDLVKDILIENGLI